MTNDERNLLLLVACYVHEMRLQNIADFSVHPQAHLLNDYMKELQGSADVLFAAIRKVQSQRGMDQ